MSFLNCVYLLALWCESVPRQLHINLVSSLYLFSSASLPWPNLWLSFPWLPIVTVTGSAVPVDAPASHGSKTCPFQDELQSDAKSRSRFGRAKVRAGFPSFISAPPHAASHLGCCRQMKGLGRLGPSSGSQHVANHKYQQHSLEFRQSGFKSQFRHFPSV